ncbi:structural toxin protein RtxA, partial [Mesorhizobium sp. M2D.F.Ca.ET.223.01.1.1]|uniref:Ig-like domain-containing protein n=1 Tax=Mesorhizobium sp. M2D.F.Ca.ET.223.01.1.1 TaxID=2563940 RepID=UPI0011357144
DGAAVGGAVTRAYFGLEANAAGATYTTISGATVIAGTYGNLTLHADGTYTYALTTASIPAGVTSETFTYEIKDGDGDLSHTTLTISIGDSTPSDTIPTPGGPTTTVYEAGLPPHGGLPAGSGEIADGNPNNNSNTSETTSGTIGFTS